MKVFNIKSLVSAIALTCSASAFATVVPVTVSTSTGSTFNTTGISNYNTGAGDMDGMKITAKFSNGSSDLAVLAGATASGSGWNTTFSGYTTFGQPWHVNVANTSGLLITSLIFSGASCDTVFDILGNATYTPGSALGKSITSTNYYGSTVSSVDATYTNKVSLNGTFYGDLYETMKLDFNSGLASGDSFSFVTDTDNSAIKGDIKPTDVPEPSSIALLALGLFGLGFRRYAKS